MHRDFKGILISVKLLREYGSTVAWKIADLYFDAPVKNKSQLIYYLKKKGFVESEIKSAEEVKRQVCEKNLYGYGIGDKICEWCAVNTIRLHEHHFPVPKRKGGKETVGICPNCHDEFHALEQTFKFSDEVEDVYSDLLRDNFSKFMLLQDSV